MRLNYLPCEDMSIKDVIREARKYYALNPQSLLPSIKQEPWRRLNQMAQDGELKNQTRKTSLYQLYVDFGLRDHRFKHSREILKQIKNYYETHGKRPHPDDRGFNINPYKTIKWNGVLVLIETGRTDLPVNTTMQDLWTKAELPRNKNEYFEITQENLLHWVDQHTHKKGSSPTRNSGQIETSKVYLTWKDIDDELKCTRYKSLDRFLAIWDRLKVHNTRQNKTNALKIEDFNMTSKLDRAKKVQIYISQDGVPMDPKKARQGVHFDF